MLSPVVNKHFPSGTSPFSSVTKTPKADVAVPANILTLFKDAKAIMNRSTYTDIYTKRDCLRNGLVPVEQKLAAVQQDYNDLYDSYRDLFKNYKLLEATTSRLIADVEDDYRLHVAKMELIAHIANLTDLTQLPTLPGPHPPTSDTCDSSAPVVSACSSPLSASSKNDKVDETDEEKAMDAAKKDGRVKFSDNYPDFHDSDGLSDAFSHALNFKVEA